MGVPETNIYDAIVIACLVMGIIIVYFFISVIRQQRQNLDMRKKSILSEISGLEKERARIASDLHDELGPLLSAVKMKINTFELADSADKVQLGKTNVHIDDILRRMREISFDLIPNTLLKKGLITALAEYIDFLNDANEMRFVFTNNSVGDIHQDKAVNIYRIVQEIVHNAIKYAEASEIRIELQNKNDIIHMMVSDNGKGFDYKKELAKKTGIGLRSLNNRAQISGGKLFVESSPGGTRYILEIPL